MITTIRRVAVIGGLRISGIGDEVVGSDLT